MALNVLGTISTSGQDGVTGTKFTLTFERTKTWTDYLNIRVFTHGTVAVRGRGPRESGKHVTWAVVSPGSCLESFQSVAQGWRGQEGSGGFSESRWQSWESWEAKVDRTELQRGELHKGCQLASRQAARLWAVTRAFSASFHGWKILSQFQVPRSEPEGPLAFSLVNLWLLLAGFWLTACGSRDSLLAQMVKSLPAMWETLVWSLGQEDPLEKEIAAHSSILAWKTPWLEEPGGLLSMGLQGVGHDRTTSPFHLSVGLDSFPTYGCEFLFLEWLAAF